MEDPNEVGPQVREMGLRPPLPKQNQRLLKHNQRRNQRHKPDRGQTAVTGRSQNSQDGGIALQEIQATLNTSARIVQSTRPTEKRMEANMCQECGKRRKGKAPMNAAIHIAAEDPGTEDESKDGEPVANAARYLPRTSLSQQLLVWTMSTVMRILNLAKVNHGLWIWKVDQATIKLRLPWDLRGTHQPSTKDVEIHSLTHFPYRSRCKHCVACKRSNVIHKSTASERTIPLLVADYGYIRDSKDQDLLTILVARVYPYRMTYSMVCDVKAYNRDAAQRLSDVIRQCGLQQFAYRRDQERSLVALIEAAMTQSGRDGRPEGQDMSKVVTPPEFSGVGESQSNGRAERGIQLVEDHVRCMKSALEDNIKVRLPWGHPVMKWLVEYVGALLRKYSVGPDGRTGFQNLHGRRTGERLVEFGEKDVSRYSPRNYTCLYTTHIQGHRYKELSDVIDL